MTRSLLVVCLVICAATSAQLPQVFIMDARRLLELKKTEQQPGNKTGKVIAGLRIQADSLLNMKPMSVMDKPLLL
ncbi:MAG: hypothetical protein WDO16_06690 [Bacteroidota bacterium]